MPKSARKNSSAVQKSDPYAGSASRKKGVSTNNVFKFNTDLGQHILKNPGVAQAIVDKADLKQSDVCFLWLFASTYPCVDFSSDRPRSRSRYW